MLKVRFSYKVVRNSKFEVINIINIKLVKQAKDATTLTFLLFTPNFSGNLQSH